MVRCTSSPLRCTKKASSPSTGCPGLVRYENPDLSGSWTTSTTSTGSTTERPHRRAVTTTRSPGDTGPGESTTNPLAVFTFQRSTSRATRSQTASPLPTNAVISERRYLRSLRGHWSRCGLVMRHLVAILSCVSLPALPGRNDAVSRRRPDYPIEDIKENGRKDGSQDNIHSSSPKDSLVREGHRKPTSGAILSSSHDFRMARIQDVAGAARAKLGEI